MSQNQHPAGTAVQPQPALLNRGLMPLGVFILLSYALLSISRICLCIWQSASFKTADLPHILLQGLRVDTATICGLYCPAALLLCLCTVRSLRTPCLHLTRIVMTAAVLFLVMNEAATPSFMNEFGVRPNHIYVAYLKYPREVIATLTHGHLLSTLLSMGAMIASGILAWRLASGLTRNYESLKPGKAVAAVLITALVTVAGVRSTTGRRPLNPSMVSFSESLTANSLPLNSTYSAVHALLHLTPDLTENEMYAFADEKAILKAWEQLSPGAVPAAGSCRLQRSITPHWQGRPKNVVIVLEESLGAAFVGSLGGAPLTPQLETLKHEGWWFENMFATGNRSRRGIEAVTAGFPPSPMHSTVILNDTQSGIANLAAIFRASGYKTAFIYGGEAHFDNMSAYFRGNGTQTVIEKKDFQDPEFTGSWGVSDEDLFKEAHRYLLAAHQAGELSYTLIFTTSFHDPFEIPEGKVSLNGEQSRWPPEKMLGAKYADYALQKFIAEARASEYWQDTVFLVIADHESKVYANESFPVDEYHIPALILGGDIRPRSDSRIVSQIDMPPTLLSLAGIGGTFPLAGQDLTAPVVYERAVLDLYSTFAYLKDGRVAVLSPHRAGVYTLDPATLKLAPAPDDPEFIAEAVAMENLGPYMYRTRQTDMQCVSLAADEGTKQ